MLFVDLVLTGGQEILAKAFRVGSIGAPTTRWPVYETYAVPEQELLEDPEKWDKAYEDVVQRPGDRVMSPAPPHHPDLTRE